MTLHDWKRAAWYENMRAGLTPQRDCIAPPVAPSETAAPRGRPPELTRAILKWLDENPGWHRTRVVAEAVERSPKRVLTVARNNPDEIEMRMEQTGNTKFALLAARQGATS